MKRCNLLAVICLFVLTPVLAGCGGGGDPATGGGALPTTGLDNAGGGEEDPNGGVGFDDESLGTDGQ